MGFPGSRFLTLLALLSVARLHGATQAYNVDEAVALAQAQNPEIAIARKKVQAARGSFIEARSGYLPSVLSTGLARERQHQTESRLRDEDYNASVRLFQNVYSGGMVPSQVAIARLNIERQEYELQATTNRVSMDVRIAFNELLLNRAKIRVREQSVGVLQEELKTQKERLSAGMVGQLNVSRAEVALANEEPELIDSQTQLKNSYLRLSELFGINLQTASENAEFDATGQLQYQPPASRSKRMSGARRRKSSRNQGAPKRRRDRTTAGNFGSKRGASAGRGFFGLRNLQRTRSRHRPRS